MDPEKIWQRFQEHMEYTDEEMELFRSDPVKVKTVTESPEFVKCKIIAEVIESTGCHAKHKVGDRFVMTGGGVLISEECPKRMCIEAVEAIGTVLPAITERFLAKSDPNFERYNIVQGSDIGLDKGGWGKILLKVYVEKFR